MVDIEKLNSWVLDAKKGDSEAFGLIYDAFSAKIFNFIKLKIQNKEAAEDLLQEVFVKAFRGLGALSAENLNFSAWLYKIASNSINDYFRSKYRTPEIVQIDETFDVPSTESPARQTDVILEMEVLNKILDLLPPLYKQVLLLRFVEGFNLNEVAGILKKSNLAIRLIQFRALKKVQAILKNEHV